MADAKTLLHLLMTKCRLEVVDLNTSANQIRIIGRIPHDDAGQNVQNFLIITKNFLIAAKTSSWNVDISKNYFLKEVGESEKVVYGYRLIFQGEDMNQHLPQICSVVDGSKPPSRVQLESFPLHGQTAERNVGKNEKGARPLGRGV